VTVNGKTATTAVTVTQDAPVTAVNAVVAVAEKAATTVVTFKALAAGENITLVGDTDKSITFTAAKSLTAAQVAAAFANLAKDATAGSASATDGVYTNGGSGTIGAGFTTGAVTVVDANNASVTFSTTTDASGTAGIQAQTIATTGSTSSKVTVATSVDGVAKVDAVTGKMGVVGGAVVIAGEITGTDVLTTVTLQGYGASSTVASDALTTLNLSKTAGGLVVTTASTGSITANLDEVGGTLSVDGGSATLTGLTLNVTGAKASEVTVTAAAVKDLTVSGSQDLKLGSSTTTALETVTVTGTAGVDLSGISANASKSINTSGTTGTVTAKIDAASATYTGGAGKDALTLTNTAAISKAISLGAGDDTLVLGATTAVPTVAVAGGDGVDTLSMNVTSAAAFDDNTAFADKISGFERLVINNSNAAATTLDLANLGQATHVTTSGTGAVVYAGAGTVYAGTTTDKLTFVYNGVTYTTAAFASTDNDAAELNTLIDAAVIVGTSTALGANKVTATLTNIGADITLVADNGAASLTAGIYDATTDIAGANQVLTLDKQASGATLVLTKGGSITAQVKDAATGTADVLNVTAQVAADVDHGVLTVANVETINLTATDTTPANTSTGAATINTSTLTLAANKAATVKIDGNANVTLTLSGAAELVTLDASAMTGKLIATAAGKTAGTTITGGAGADELTASGTGDVLIGGAGNDKLVAADLSTLTGGAGNDTFVLNAAPSTLNAYSTITDLTAGDKIDTTAKTFKSDAITLASTASFQDFANAAVLAVDADAGDAAAWFQFGGNTFLVVDKDSNTGSTSAGDGSSFENNADLIIAITGLVNLSTAVFNASTGDFTIA